MKKKFLYPAVVSVFAVLLCIIIYSYTNKKNAEAVASYELLPRKAVLAQDPAWPGIQANAQKYLNALKQNDIDSRAMLQLGNIFIGEARVTGNYTYYDKAALAYVNRVLDLDSANFEALVLKSLLYLSQHHFTDGLNIALKAKNQNPYNAYVYGLLTDAYVETGMYDSAVASAQKMVDTRPDIRSYSRVSYLREIYGDYPGAIEAMQDAVNAGVPGDESTEWARIHLGQLYENTGDIKNAEMQYMFALEQRPGYAYANAGLGRIALANKKYDEAVQYFSKASDAVADDGLKEQLATAYRLQGNTAKANSLMKEVIDDMNASSNDAQKDENIGHYVDRELAYAYIITKDYDKALEHALLEYNRRPGNIDVNECAAWAYYYKGDYTKALSYIKTAMQTNSKNPTLLCRAGLIYAKAGDMAKAKELLQAALQNNPNIDSGLMNDAMNTLKALQ